MIVGEADSEKVIVSVYKAALGGFIGNTGVHPDMLEIARERLSGFREKGRIRDFHVMRCGDDIELLVTHYQGSASKDVEQIVMNVFSACSVRSSELKLAGASCGLARGAFPGNVEGLAYGLAEMEFTERKSETMLVFMADKVQSGLWNMALYKIYADPFNTPGLVMDEEMMDGFTFTVIDRQVGETVVFKCPEELYRLLALIGDSSRYVVSEVRRSRDGELAAAVSTERFGGYEENHLPAEGGGADPVLVMRCQAGLPAVGEALEVFTFPYLVEGWLRGVHIGPLMPVPFYEANPTRSDGPPRVIAAGFQLSRGRLIGPQDMFDDVAFDQSRREASKVSDYMRRHGPFKPHRVMGKSF